MGFDVKVKRLTMWRRVSLALGAVICFCVAAGLLAAGFALSSVWPGVSWAVGGALALVILLLAGSWLRAAVSGRPRERQERPAGKGGTM